MKYRNIMLVIIFLIIYAGSCEEPKTTVTNNVHTDGSVLRQLEMRFPEKEFKISDVQVPYDSTWTIRDSLEINAKSDSTWGDSTWVRRAEKLFRTVDGINREYMKDSSKNRDIVRRAEFKKKFRWFTTAYRYDEVIENKLLYGYPVSKFLNTDELKWFYSPDNLNDEKKNGPDSLRYRAFDDSIRSKIDKWTIRNFMSEWMHEFAGLTRKTGKGTISLDSLKKNENEYSRIIEKYEEHFDSLWANGTILREMIGEENAGKFRTEADSAIKISTNRCFAAFSNYTVRTLMPGKLTTTNGLVDSSGIVLWPVKSDYFLSETYDMRAESKVPNRWAWIVSGIFLLFVFTGILLRKSGKG